MSSIKVYARLFFVLDTVTFSALIIGLVAYLVAYAVDILSIGLRCRVWGGSLKRFNLPDAFSPALSSTLNLPLSGWGVQTVSPTKYCSITRTFKLLRALWVTNDRNHFSESTNNNYGSCGRNNYAYFYGHIQRSKEANAEINSMVRKSNVLECLICSFLLPTKTYGFYSFPSQELLALEALYNSTNGAHWRWIEPYSIFGYPWNFLIPEVNPCIEEWQGVNCSSNCLLSQCYTTILQLAFHNLSGTIPPELGNLSSLQHLDLYTNHLLGTIPSELSYLTPLLGLDLHGNHLSGTLPPELGKFPSLQYMSLYNNRLTGTTPPEFGNLVLLQGLWLDVNHLSGTIPPELGKLSSLQYLGMYNNQLNGTIPSELGNLSLLQFLYLYINQLSGTIPPELGNLSSLLYLTLYTNYLTGTTPVNLGKLSSLQYLALYINHLSGTIPPELGKLSSLQYLGMYNNQLNGTIPSELGNLSLLQFLYLYINQLSGTIPPELGNLSLLQYLNLYSNELSHTIPSELGNLSSLQYLELFNNQLSGTIPPELGKLSLLQRLNLYINKLSGTIPSELGNLSLLQYLELYDNLLTGSIPNGLENLKILNSVYLFNNLLSGSIPSGLFHDHSTLQVFVASQNCLTGSIPENICLSQQLTTVVLDGMGTASFCRRRLFLGISNQVYTIKSASHAGTIPTCLLQLQNIVELQLSGLLLSGTIPDARTLPKRLQVLSLSNNQLIGSIPPIYLHHNFSALDLSFNRLNGVIDSNVLVHQNSYLNLQINRLSGAVSSSLQTLKNIDILDGNMFACNYDNAKLPQNDPNARSYECGSDYVNVSFVLWIVFAILCILVLLWKEKEFLVSFVSNRDKDIWMMDGDIETYCSLFQQGIMLFVWLAMGCLLLMCVYALLKSQFHLKTYSYQYAWTLSSCFLTGVTPSTVLLALWNCVLGGVLHTSSNIHRLTAWATLFVQRYDVASCIAIVTIVSCVNGAYVYGIQQNLDKAYLVLMTICLSIFKTLTLYVSYRVFRQSTSKYVLVAVLVYCQIIAPYLGELLVSTNCFYYAVLETPPKVKYLIPIQDCTLGSIENVCGNVPTKFYYDPPFTYSYSCSSSLITSFGYVFVLRYVWVLLSVPLRYLLEYSKLQNSWVKNLANIMELFGNSDSTSRLENLVITSIVDLAVLLTFGVLFPPLGLVICFTVLVRCIQNRIYMQHLLQKSREDSSAKELLNKFTSHCDELKSLFVSSLTYLGILSAWFWAFTLFDTLGDAVGATKASGIVVAMCISPFLWLTIFWIIRRYKNPRQLFEDNEPQENPMQITRESELAVVREHISESGI